MFSINFCLLRRKDEEVNILFILKNYITNKTTNIFAFITFDLCIVVQIHPNSFLHYKMLGINCINNGFWVISIMIWSKIR